MIIIIIIIARFSNQHFAIKCEAWIMVDFDTSMCNAMIMLQCWSETAGMFGSCSAAQDQSADS